MRTSSKPPLPFGIFKLLIAAFLAITLPWAWLDYSDSATHTANELNFHPLLIVLYAPLAFGIVWPALLYLHSHWTGPDFAWPRKTALVLFILCSLLSIPFVAAEYIHLSTSTDRLQVEERQRRAAADEFKSAKLHATVTLESKGIASLNDPLTSPETAALDDYIRDHKLLPADMLLATRKYRTAMDPLMRIASLTSCPPEVLDALLDNILDPRPLPYEPNATARDLVELIARNPNATPDLLVRILEAPELNGQAAALDNPALPHAAKIAFLTRCAKSSRWFDRKLAANNPDTPVAALIEQLETGDPSVADAVKNPNVPDSAKVLYVHKQAASTDVSYRMWAAENPFCPLDDLKRLAEESPTSAYAASNPNLPLDLLENLTKSQDAFTRSQALQNKAKRSHQ